MGDPATLLPVPPGPGALGDQFVPQVLGSAVSSTVLVETAVERSEENPEEMPEEVRNEMEAALAHIYGMMFSRTSSACPMKAFLRSSSVKSLIPLRFIRLPSPLLDSLLGPNPRAVASPLPRRRRTGDHYTFAG
mmetsp:Transcript_42762/g.100243  ORF Transcript_42762/g.100243 Transcript_42762/m.100243 type:complete len:134 (-) Transcript_42762:66-467(-)